MVKAHVDHHGNLNHPSMVKAHVDYHRNFPFYLGKFNGTEISRPSVASRSLAKPNLFAQDVTKLLLPLLM
jgi:hypothetical protein